MNIKKIVNNYKKTEINFNVDYGKSQTDKTHFRPNVNIWNDLQGATNNVGMYDNDYETGKMRAIIMNPALDRAEVDEYVKHTYENARNELDAEKMKVLEQMQNEIDTNDTNNGESKTENQTVSE